ncbi:MAG TPA: hypothetical protein PKO06_18910 [Candidatus Ozemobacteraceae bacterium]|nr:hypothetical protein [Candidatus Ozemobacteraceae bacterium]
MPTHISFDTLLTRVQRAFALTHDLVASLSDQDLGKKIGDLPSNTIRQQLWCIVGARESYAKAIDNGGWAGFSCSLTQTDARDAILQALKKSELDFVHIVSKSELTGMQIEYFLALHEHEIQHHGQLIRYVYANRLDFPQSWNKRYTV